MRYLPYVICVTLTGCGGALTKAPKSEKYQLESTLQSLRTDVATLQNDLHSHQVFVDVLENRMESQENKSSQLQENADELRTSTLSSQQKHILHLENKILALEKLHEKTYELLQQQTALAREFEHALTQSKERAIQLETHLSSQQQGLDELLHLKSAHLNNQSMHGAFVVLFFPHTVKTEDTLEKVATQYNTSAHTIKLFNNLTSDTLPVGKTILIPQGEAMGPNN